MENFKKCFSSLIEQLGDDYKLGRVLEFVNYFRCDDINLYNEFNKNYQSVGYYSSEKLVELYCKYYDIELSNANAPIIFEKLVKNIWDDNMGYHLTTSVSALNIYENGMDPSKKEEGIDEDINSLSGVLSDYGKKLFMPYIGKDLDKYCFSYIPKLNNNYGKKPEWFLNLTFYQNGTVEEIMPSILRNMEEESLEAKDKMYSVISKYHEIYSKSSRTLVVIPGLTEISSSSIIDYNNIDSIQKLYAGVQTFLGYRSSYIDEKSNKVVPSEDLLFIDVASKKIVDFNNKDKKV